MFGGDRSQIQTYVVKVLSQFPEIMKEEFMYKALLDSERDSNLFHNNGFTPQG